ncbi:unnamed protein product [Prunus brigantina]
MLRDESRMVRILMICPLDRRSVLLNSPKIGRLLSSVRELKSDEFGDRDMLREVVCVRSSSLVEKQRDADAPLRSSSHLHQSKSGSQSGQSTHPSNHRVSNVESRAVKHGADSPMLIPLEVRLAYAMKARESFGWAKSSSAMADASMSDLLKMNFQVHPLVLSWLIKSVRLAILVLSQVFPWKNKGKQDFISFKKEVLADVVDQAGGAAVSVADQANAEESADQGSPAGVSE